MVYSATDIVFLEFYKVVISSNGFLENKKSIMEQYKFPK